MVLNYIWVCFLFIAFIVALVKLIFFGDYLVFPNLMTAIFDSSKLGFEISLYLTGVLAFWLGILKVGEKGGVVRFLGRLIAPLLSRLMPDLPKNHPAHGTIIMNIAANMLGLDNAATPMGLQAMKEMQQENRQKDTASNPQILFLVLNTSGLTLIPVSIMAFRVKYGAANPSDIFIPILLATYFSTLAGLLIVAYFQKLKLWNKVVMSYLVGMTVFIIGIVAFFASLDQEMTQKVSSQVSSILLFSIVISFVALAIWKKVNVYDAFIEGAKGGFGIAVKIIPYLVAILVAIGVFRASGAMDMLVEGFRIVSGAIGINADFVEALPTALMKPLSGNGARGMMLDAMNAFGADSFVGRIACTVQGATDTTFYVIAVYFGSVGIKNVRHALVSGLFADFVGIVAAIVIGYLFFY